MHFSLRAGGWTFKIWELGLVASEALLLVDGGQLAVLTRPCLCAPFAMSLFLLVRTAVLAD